MVKVEEVFREEELVISSVGETGFLSCFVALGEVGEISERGLGEQSGEEKLPPENVF